MPAKVKVRILAGRNLPVMDKSSDASDAFVEVKLGNTTYKTEVYRRSLNPFWNSEWFRFEVSDQELQDEPLQIRIMDYDTYSANDAIGKVYINLNPLLLNPGRSMSGWLPIYDTLHGIRGEINCMVKVNLFVDNNRYRHSSCGVRFFFSDIPNGYKCDAVLGFVDELLVNDDPEYQWIDKIRTPRASNEARQTLFTKLSGEVQRKLGLKAEIFGGNAVIGYQQSFDLEGGSGIVGRGIGTAVVLSKIGYPYEGIISPLHTINQNPTYPYNVNERSLSRADRSTSQSFIIHQKQHPYIDRHLVHSVSADYFYEVPTDTYNKQITSAALESSSKVQKSQTMHRIGGKKNDLSDDDSDYYDLESSQAKGNDDDSDSDFDKPSAKFVGTSDSSPIKCFSSLNKSLNLIGSVEAIESYRQRTGITTFTTNKRKLSTASLMRKLTRSGYENVSQKLSYVTKPTKSLTKLLSLSKHTNHTTNPASWTPQRQSGSNQMKQLGQSQQQYTQQSTNDEAQKNPHPTKSLSEESSSQHHNITVLSNQKSTNSSKSTTSFKTPTIVTSPSAETTASSPSTTATSSGSIYKRRKEKSQSASVDDALSIIEEKLDDDPDYISANSEIRPRLLSGSSKLRQMVRAKEIDLNDDNESVGGSYLRPKGLSIGSSVDDDDIEDSNVSSSATTLASCQNVEAKPTTMAINPSETLSSSSPSTSMLTSYETIKAKELIDSASSGKPRLLAQMSSPSDPSKQNASLHRSDTDLAHSRLVASSGGDNKQLSNASDSIDVSMISSVNRSDMKRGSPDSRQSSSLKLHGNNQAGSSNFAQSVRVVKTQQHLLQQMIRQQNQNLLSSSFQKAKNAFMYANRVHQSEYPFVTLKKYPDNMIQCTGGVVSVHSVKLLDHIINDEESETRDIWWTEIRKEIRSHTKALSCNTVLGYSETSKVLGDVCILSAFGTAALLKPMDEQQDELIDYIGGSNQQTIGAGSSSLYQLFQTLKVPRLSSNSPPPSHTSMPVSRSLNQAAATEESQKQLDQSSTADNIATSSLNQEQQRKTSVPSSGINQTTAALIDCSFCHSPLVCVESIASLASCTVCKSSKVPDVILLTIEPPKNLNIVSTGTLVQARVCRAKRDSHGEASAKEIGDALPFLEYELHRQLFSKLKFKGLNCLFNLSIDISVGENMLTGIATGTGCFVLGLPTPEPPQISAGKGIKTSKLSEIQRLIAQSSMRNRESLGLKQIDSQLALYRERLRSVNIASAGSQPQQSTSPARQNSKDETDSVHSPPLPTTQQPLTNPLVQDAAQQDNKNAISNFDQSIFQQRATTSSQGGRPQSGHRQRASSTSVCADHSRDQGHHSYHNSHSHYQHHRYPHLTQKSSQATDRSNMPAPAGNLVNLLTDDNNIVLEVDDNEDADIIALLIDSDIPDGYLVCNSESIPTISQTSITSINMFTQVTRAKLTGIDQFAQQFDWILQALFVKLRRSLPCCLSNVSFVVDLPESQVAQISVTGCLLGLKSCPLPGQTMLVVDECDRSVRVVDINNDQSSASCNTQDGSERRHQEHQKRRQQTSTTSTTSMSPSSSSSSDSPSSSSSESTLRSSNSSSSVKSVKETQAGKNQQQQQQQSSTKTATTTTSTPLTSTSVATKMTEQAKSLTKQLSKTNISALLKVGGSDKKKLSGTELELTDRQGKGATGEGEGSSSAVATANTSTPTSSTSTRAAVKQEIQQNWPQTTTTSSISPSQQQSQQQQRQKQPQSSYSMRSVFKKQQTYPGATSPMISGHENKMLPFSSNESAAVTSPISGGAGGNAARRATIILNKVTQPLKELGSNFNATNLLSGNTIHSDSIASVTPAGSSSGGGNKETAGGTGTGSSSSSSSGKGTTTTEAALAGCSAGGWRSSSGASISKSRHFSGQLASGSGGPSSSGGSPYDVTGSLDASTIASQVLPGGGGPSKGGASIGDRTANSSIDITSLSYIPGAKEYHYLGNLSFSFVRETNSVRENGGLNGFIHCFLMEVHAIVRAHVSALGGNAFLSFRLQQSCIFYHSNKNQAQCLISVAGDAVQVTL